MDCVERQFQICPKFERTFAILGKKWNGLIIDVLLEEGPQRFVELASKIPNVSDRVLVERLKELEDKKIISRDMISEETTRAIYQLTEKGQDLKQVMLEIQTWGEKWSD
ncbi:winged helix-turn-helix transcriptional regulator [Vagococcus sp.]|uniref:winged helix-turn-helix transcriptional regulator n=1 Tax=Vagococcus sp. TaxID=1933889 RepID=UPI003F96E120